MQRGVPVRRGRFGERILKDPGKEKNCHSLLSENSLRRMRAILILILILLLIGALPTWPYSTGWGYYPTGGLGLVLLIVLILWLMGRI
jgi:hypothetical protein